MSDFFPETEFLLEKQSKRRRNNAFAIEYQDIIQLLPQRNTDEIVLIDYLFNTSSRIRLDKDHLFYKGSENDYRI